MQFKIPQNVQREDTIVGPITFKQLGILLVGGGFTYAIYIILARTYVWTVWAPPVVILAGLTLAVTFLKIKDMTALQAFFYFLEYSLKPKTRHWEQGKADLWTSVLYTPNKKNEKKAENKEELTPEDKRKKLLEISKNVNRLSSI